MATDTGTWAVEKKTMELALKKKKIRNNNEAVKSRGRKKGEIKTSQHKLRWELNAGRDEKMGERWKCQTL